MQYKKIVDIQHEVDHWDIEFKEYLEACKFLESALKLQPEHIYLDKREEKTLVSVDDKTFEKLSDGFYLGIK